MQALTRDARRSCELQFGGRVNGKARPMFSCLPRNFGRFAVGRRLPTHFVQSTLLGEGRQGSTTLMRL